MIFLYFGNLTKNRNPSDLNYSLASIFLSRRGGLVLLKKIEAINAVNFNFCQFGLRKSKLHKL